MITKKQKQKYQQMTKNQLNKELNNVCISGNLEIVRYLLTSPDLKEHADIHTNDTDTSLQYASAFGHLGLVKYLLTSPDLKEYGHIHSENDKLFISACSDKNKKMLEYFIFDYMIEKTEHIENHLIEHDYKNDYEDILMMFEKRDLEEKLQKKLQNDNINYHKMKI